MTDDDGNFAGPKLPGYGQRVKEKRFSRQRMKDFGQAGFHARSLPGR
jgi:hypothetical protein